MQCFLIMRQLLLICLSVCVITACNPDKNTKVDQTTISFKTNDATKLFFKNVRQTYYDLEDMSAAKMQVFRLKKRYEENERPAINLAIVNNWRYDEAYLLLEPNDLIDLSAATIKWRNEETGDSGEIRFENGNKETLVKFADQLYDQIQQGSLFRFEKDGVEVNILENSDDREAFRITMVDYYRLVQRL